MVVGAVACPSTWNSLPDSLRHSALNIFRRPLKTLLRNIDRRDVLGDLEIF